jgi:hypothetical protein
VPEASTQIGFSAAAGMSTVRNDTNTPRRMVYETLCFGDRCIAMTVTKVWKRELGSTHWTSEPGVHVEKQIGKGAK